VLNAERQIYICRECDSEERVVCKFFARESESSSDHARQRLQTEYQNLCRLRRLGFDSRPFQVIRPLSVSEPLHCLLVEELAPGHHLDHALLVAATEGEDGVLLDRIDLMARFFHTWHARTARSIAVPFDRILMLYEALVTDLERDYRLPVGYPEQLRTLLEHWRHEPRMWSDEAVWVHGDATPTNFIVHQNSVTAIDLERMKVADRVYDLGFLAAEIKHSFALRAFDAKRADPFIHHLYRRYCDQETESKECFENLTHRNRFYMALGELRIARHPWLPEDHRDWLVREAIACLKE
jgi:hypothetical protein